MIMKAELYKEFIGSDFPMYVHIVKQRGCVQLYKARTLNCVIGIILSYLSHQYSKNGIL